MNIRTFAGPLFKTRVSFHYTWYLTIILMTAVIVTRFPQYYTFTQRLLLGLGGSVLFLLGIIVRQFAVNMVAYYRKIPLRGVVLYPFGGVSLVAKEESLPILELLVAAVGLLAHLLVVMIFYVAYIVLVIVGNETLSWLIQWLAYINALLFLIHFVPGFPLDGGRILRAIIWKYTHNYSLSTRISVHLGQGAGALFLCGGIALLVYRQWFVGLMIAFLGMVLLMAATSSNRNVAVTRSLEGVLIEQVMTREFSLIPRNLSLSILAKDFILPKGHYRFVVFDESKLHGMITLEELKSVPRKNWEKITAGQIMIPAEPQNTAFTGQNAADLLDRMNVYGINYLPIMDKNQVVGIADKEILLRFNKTRKMLKI